jgi:hypothetical protein
MVEVIETKWLNFALERRFDAFRGERWKGSRVKEG